MTIRSATSADVPALLAIYAPYSTDSSITFDYDVPSDAEFAERIQIIQKQFSCLVAETDGRILGYAYASRHRGRSAYQWSVETSSLVHTINAVKGNSLS